MVERRAVYLKSTDGCTSNCPMIGQRLSNGWTVYLQSTNGLHCTSNCQSIRKCRPTIKAQLFQSLALLELPVSLQFAHGIYRG